MLSKLRNRQKGFTLIELLIVVAIIGIIAAILIPNFLDALHKGRQKRTMGDIRQFGLGLGQYYSEHSGAAAAGAQTTIDISEWAGTSTVDELSAALVPDYITQVPERDGWGHAYEFHVILNNPPRIRYALVRSPGRDDVFSGTSYTAGSFGVTDYDQDIVWGDGGFFRAPQSAQAGS